MSKKNINLIDSIMISLISGLLYTIIAITQPLVNIQENYPFYIILMVFIRGFVITLLSIGIYEWYLKK